MNSINIIKQLIPGLRDNETWTQWVKSFIGGTYEDSVELSFKITNLKVGQRGYVYIYVTEESTESLGLNIGVDDIVEMECFTQDQWMPISPSEFNLTNTGILTMKLEGPVLYDWATGSIQKIKLHYKVTQTVLPRQFEVQWPHYLKTVGSKFVINKLSTLFVAIRLLRNCLRRDVLQSEQQVDRRVILTKDGEGTVYNPIRYLGFKWFTTSGYVRNANGRVEVVVSDKLPPNIALDGVNCIIAETEDGIWDEYSGRILCEATAVINNCAHCVGPEDFNPDPDYQYKVAFRYPSVMLHESDYVDYKEVSEEIYSNDPNNVLPQLIEQKPAWKGYTVESKVRQNDIVQNAWRIPAFGYSTNASHKIKLDIPDARLHDEYTVEYDPTVITSASISNGYLYISSYGKYVTDVTKVILNIRNTTTGGSLSVTTYWCPSQDLPSGTMTTLSGDISLASYALGDFIEVPLIKDNGTDTSVKRISILIPFNESSVVAKYNQYTLELFSKDSLYVEDAEWKTIANHYYLSATLVVNTIGESMLRIVSIDTGIGKDYLIKVTKTEGVNVQASKVFMSDYSTVIPITLRRGWELKDVASSNEEVTASITSEGVVCSVVPEMHATTITSEITATFIDPMGMEVIEKFSISKRSEVPKGAYRAEFSKYGTLQAQDLGLVVQSPAFFSLQPGAEITLSLANMVSLNSNHSVSDHRISVKAVGSTVVVSALDDNHNDLATANVGIGTPSVQRFVKFYSLGSSGIRKPIKTNISVVPTGTADVTIKGSSSILREGDNVTVTVVAKPGHDVASVVINGEVKDVSQGNYNILLLQENRVTVITVEQDNPPVFCSFSTTNFAFTAIEVDQEGSTIRTRYVGNGFGLTFNYGTRMKLVPRGVADGAKFVGWFYKDDNQTEWIPVPGQVEGSQELDVVLTEKREYRCFWIV